MRDLYAIAREVTDEVLGEGSYARLNWDNPDPKIREAARAAGPPEPEEGGDVE